MFFDKLLRLLKNNAALLLLSSLGIRSLLYGSNIGDALVIISLCSLVGFIKFQEKKEVTELDELKQDVKILKDAIQGLKIERAIRRPQNESNQNQGRFF